MIKLEKNISYQGWKNCLRLTNAEIELVIATDIGLRILHLGFIGGENIFYLSPEEKGLQGGNQWRIYGGHRLWLAPESIPGTYSPDNDPIEYNFDSGILRICQPWEISTGIVKEMEITISPEYNQINVLHRLINKNHFSIKLSAWALSVLRPGGRVIIPQEPYGAGDDYLLPARSLALWSYTNMNDPRWIWGQKFIQAKQDPSQHSEQKIGVLNKQGWTAYCREEEYLIKTFAFDPAAEYPDFGSNNETYINEKFIEMETLGPLVNIPPQGKTEHTECWLLSRGILGEKEESIGQRILPEIAALQKRILHSNE
ncbi:MAG TPA: hypothetical protein VK622_03725 [Puia sp.]|nr:hypothetical protein [Puia sp.]